MKKTFSENLKSQNSANANKTRQLSYSTLSESATSSAYASNWDQNSYNNKESFKSTPSFGESDLSTKNSKHLPNCSENTYSNQEVSTLYPKGGKASSGGQEESKSTLKWGENSYSNHTPGESSYHYNGESNSYNWEDFEQLSNRGSGNGNNELG